MRTNQMKKGLTVVIIILFVGVGVYPVFAVNIKHTSDIEKTSDNKNSFNKEEEIYINPNVQFTRTDLPVLKSSLCIVKNSDYGYVLQQIINVIEEKGVVNSNDVREILLNSDSDIKGVYSSCNITAQDCAGYANSIPGFFKLKFFGLFFGQGSYYCKGGIMWWVASQGINCLEYISVRVGNETYTQKHRGLALEYTGSIVYGTYFLEFDQPLCHYFYLDGYATTVFVK